MRSHGSKPETVGIMSDVEVTQTANDHIENVALSLKKLNEHTVTWKGQNGYFVSKKLMKTTEDQLRHAIKNVNTAEDTALLEEHATQLNQMRERCNLMYSAMKALETERDSKKKSLEEVQELVIKLQKDSTIRRAREGEVNKLKKELADKEIELGQAKIKSKASMRSSDVDGAQKIQEHEDTLRNEVKLLQEQRRLADAGTAALETELTKTKEKKAGLELDLASLHKEISVAKSLNAQAQSVSSIEPVNIELSTPLATLLLGKKGMEWLSKIDYNMRINLRNYAQTLMTTAASSNPTRGLVDLLKLVVEWMKDTTYVAREKIRPWLIMIETHLKAGVVRSMGFYRDELKKIIGDFKASVKAQQESEPGRASYHTNTVAFKDTVLKFVRRNVRPKSWWSSIKSRAKKIGRKIREVYLGFTSWFGNKTSIDPLVEEDIPFFDHFETIDLHDNDPQEESSSAAEKRARAPPAQSRNRSSTVVSVGSQERKTK